MKPYYGTLGPKSSKPNFVRGHQKDYRIIANRAARARSKQVLREHIIDPDRDINDFKTWADSPL